MSTNDTRSEPPKDLGLDEEIDDDLHDVEEDLDGENLNGEQLSGLDKTLADSFPASDPPQAP